MRSLDGGLPATSVTAVPAQDRRRAILCVVGARPNYMKMAPLLRALAMLPQPPRAILVHTGQHYDPALKDQLFDDLRLPPPDENLDVRSGSHAVQTAEVMKRFEPLLDRYDPACIVVVGDVNSTLACSLVAAKRCVPVVHVEAGLRSYDRTMPEEINRVLTDQISDLLFTTDPQAHVNLALEGISGDHVVFAGNLMIDSLHDALPRAVTPQVSLAACGVDAAPFLEGHGFALVTLHRPSNVDDRAVLTELVELLRSVSERVALVWPMHPRAHAQLERFDLLVRLRRTRIALLPPQGYLEMVGLMCAARLAITDSGGVQEETTALGIPCLTLRDNTERPITVTQGSNRLMKRDVIAMHEALDDILSGPVRPRPAPEGWDGRAGERIAGHLSGWLSSR